MMQRSSKTLIVADHSKFNNTFPGRYASWRQVDCLVTDQQPTGKLLQCLNQNRVTFKLSNEPAA